MVVGGANQSTDCSSKLIICGRVDAVAAAAETLPEASVIFYRVLTIHTRLYRFSLFRR